MLVTAFSGCAARPVESLPIGDWSPRYAADEPPGTAQALPVELRTILRLAGERALGVSLAKAQAAAAAADREFAQSQWLPTLQPRVTLLSHEGRLQSTEGVFFDVDKQSAFGGAAAEIQFNLADAWFDSIAAARRAYAARLGIRTAQHINIVEAVRLYYDLLEVTASLQIAQRTVTHAEEFVVVQDANEKAGRGLHAHVLRANAFRAAAVGRVAVVEARVSETTARLAGLLVLPIDTKLIPAQGKVEPIEFNESGLPMPVLIERALGSRPEIAAARSLVAATEVESDRASWSWVVPELLLGAEYGAFGFNGSSTHGREDYFADLRWRWGLGGFARARAADARFEEQRVRLRILEQRARTELHVAVAAVKSAKARLAAGREEIAAASLALDLVKLRHREGKVLLLEVLDAETINAAAGTNLVGAICAQNRAQFELHRLLGVN